MTRAGYQAAGSKAAPAHQQHTPKLDERLEEEQRLENRLEDDEVREALKRVHADQKTNGGKPA